ncbi:MAG: Uma2 family endonuclease [Chloroflexi bacterium]|nr:Uma2 family endonuclease [Chloroflexota bacterium]MBI5053117.1 Uma2 family endonuclease [Chloroflexota bacterium]MBI5082523.1 Uma2 family endonuclease [Chloroflexota bacterium]
MIADRSSTKTTRAEAERWTYQRYRRETAEGEHFEVIEGIRTMAPSPSRFHQYALTKLASQLETFVTRENLGTVLVAPFDVYFSEDEFVQPDILFVAKDHSERLTDHGVRGAPDLVIEIVSPGSTRMDRITKRNLYAKHGVPEYWIISPNEQTIEVLTLQNRKYETAGFYEEDDSIASPTLIGFSCVVRDIFVRDDES